jgi:1,4-alpha-glucan branching enzyme
MVSNRKPIKRRRVKLTFEAPEAKEVILMGDFNDWNAKRHPMKKNKDGVWEKRVMLPPGRYEYKFLVDGQWWTDPKNEETCYNCFGTENSVMVIDLN